METRSHWFRKPPFYYGYLMLPLAVIMQIGTCPGQTFAISAFTPSLIESLGLSQSRLALAYMLGTMLAGIPLMIVGPTSDRYGLRRVSMVVIAAFSLACLFASTASGFYSLLAAFFCLRFLGQGSLTLLAGNTMAMWFRTKLGRVSAVMSIGSAIAFAWIPEILTDVIGSIGWRSTYQVLACVLAVVLLPLVGLFFRNRPEDVGQWVDGIQLDHRLAQAAPAPISEPGSAERHTDQSDAPTITESSTSLTLAQAARTATYYILALASIVWAMSGTGVVFYLFTLCQERALPESSAENAFKVLGFAMLTLQLSGGVLGDFMALNRLFGIGTVMIAASFVWLFFDPTTTGLYAFSVLFGGGQGMLISITGLAWPRFYGREHLGSIRGAVWCGTVAGSGCGPLIMGWFKDNAGSYDIAVLIFGALMTPLAIAAWFIRPPNAQPA